MRTRRGLSGQSIGRLPLESCQTINEHWGYNITDTLYKSPKELIQMLVRAAGKNANLLLNIGPEPGGALPELALNRLQAIGKWLNQYGETIYGTRGGIIAPHEWGVSTQRGNKLYIHILNCMDSSLFIPTGNHKNQVCHRLWHQQTCQLHKNWQRHHPQPRYRPH